jgi:tRNA threonylcarbamoyladenosine biosynthesis protein TsaE
MNPIEIDGLSGLNNAAQAFIEQMGPFRIFAFHGEMGAGKTTFIKAVCQQMGVAENITSPTFALVNEYRLPGEGFIYHFDCYRLKNSAEAYDFGAEEYFYSGHYCFIEWPERIEPLLPDDAVWVDLLVLPDQKRRITFSQMKQDDKKPNF